MFPRASIRLQQCATLASDGRINERSQSLIRRESAAVWNFESRNFSSLPNRAVFLDVLDYIWYCVSDASVNRTDRSTEVASTRQVRIARRTLCGLREDNCVKEYRETKFQFNFFIQISFMHMLFQQRFKCFSCDDTHMWWQEIWIM